MSDITLTQGIRDNLLSLQNTSDLMSRTQNRLATGRKINSALDNPNSFFTAKALSNRANDLATLLDNIGQGIQTIKAADQGLTAITKLVEAAKAKANQAQLAADTFARSGFVNEYNGLLTQIAELATDSGYNGKNLLAGAGNQVVIHFNEDNSNYLTIDAIDYTDLATSLGLPALTESTFGSLAVPLTDGTDPLTLSSLVVADTTNFTATGNTLAFEDAGGTPIGSVAVTPSMTVAELVAEINRNFTTVRASFASGTLTIESTVDINIAGGDVGGGFEDEDLTATPSSWQTDSGIAATLVNIADALDRLRSQASTFGTHLTVVQNRQDFTKKFVTTLESGADMLTLADTNEEGANLLALQTRQQLSSTALSLASQADQSVLRLFG